jgi:ZIP family zinc transporter
MNTWLSIILLTLMAGLAMPAGALLASVEKIHPDWLEQELRHAIIAFGGGALLSAIALVLVPESIATLSLLGMSLSFAGGGLAFMLLDVSLSAMKTRASQLSAMLADFIPEALALGATLASGSRSGYLLAILIALQNVPEGFNAYREMMKNRAFKGRTIIIAFSLMALLGPIAGCAGYGWLSSMPELVSGIMLFAAGGILYLVFQDIAPQAKLEKHWVPPLGAVSGFMLGLIGLRLLH